MKNALTHIRGNLFQMTQVQFAAVLGVDQSTVSRWEQGKLDPGLKDLRKIRALARNKKRAEEWKKRGIEWSDGFLFGEAA
jgi:DNA-binding transcriptional regulator YiaG